MCSAHPRSQAESLVRTAQSRAIIALRGRSCGRITLLSPAPQGHPVSRWRMSPLMLLFIAWGVLTAVLVVLLIYRSTLTMQEDDQLFLDASESHMEQEQIVLMKKVDKLNPLVKWLSAASGLLILVIAGIWIYHGLNASN